jgi:hypothetical protein
MTIQASFAGYGKNWIKVKQIVGKCGVYFEGT